ncbi:MAG: hypothetical protein HQL67_08340 [Magnetococcales bacterium]|nr:hypothetical protein [Magnetococcales bacterium]
MRNKIDTDHSYDQQLTLNLEDAEKKTVVNHRSNQGTVVNINEYRASTQDYRKAYDRLLKEANKLDW